MSKCKALTKLDINELQLVKAGKLSAAEFIKRAELRVYRKTNSYNRRRKQTKEQPVLVVDEYRVDGLLYQQLILPAKLQKEHIRQQFTSCKQRIVRRRESIRDTRSQFERELGISMVRPQVNRYEATYQRRHLKSYRQHTGTKIYIVPPDTKKYKLGLKG